MLKILKYFLFIFPSWFIIHSTCILVDGLYDDTGKAELAIIFGNTVNKDGTLSPRLKARLDKGLELYKDSTIKKIFVSGGLGKEGHYEGTKMAEYLIAQGIPADVIQVDNKGNNTYLTAKNTIETYPSLENVIVVTQYHHITRAKLAMRKVGIKHVYGIHCDYFEGGDVLSIIREFFAYYKYLMVY